MRLAPLAALFALAGPTLGACMMGPDFHSPDPPATNLYLADDQPAGLVASAPSAATDFRASTFRANGGPCSARSRSTA